MNIVEATKAALKENKCIKRKRYRNKVIIMPTKSSSYHCVLIFPKMEKMYPRWNPSADDLIAEDWIVTENPNPDWKLPNEEEIAEKALSELLESFKN